MRPIRIVAALALLVTLSVPALPPSTGWANTLEPLVVGWERIFNLDWQVTDKGGRPVVSGYLVNDSPHIVTAIQLLIDALDANGAIVRQNIGWAGAGAIQPFSRMYFELPAPRAAATYRVRVFAFDRIESKPKHH